MEEDGVGQKGFIQTILFSEVPHKLFNSVFNAKQNDNL